MPLRKLTLVALVLFGMSGAALAETYDVVILNGRVIDPETSLDAVRNVGVKGGKIAEITEEVITGKETIDASGHVVSPGFIDGHVHVVDAPLGQKAALRDGVTTTMDLEVGAYPVDLWYDNLSGRSQTNYGATVSVGGARTKVFKPDYQSVTGNIQTDLFSGVDVGIDWSTRIATPAEQQQILDILETGLKRGALGIGPPIGYMTEGFTTSNEIDIQKLVAKYGLFTHVHVRFMSQSPPTSALLAIQEAVGPAVAFGGGVIIAHLPSNALALTSEAIEYVDALRAKGVHVALEAYPYNIAAAGNGISADYLHPDNFQRNMGRSYEDIIDTQTGKRLDKATFDRLIKDHPNHPVMFYTAKEEDMLKAVSTPDLLIGSDAFQFNDPKTGKRAADWDTPWDAVNTHPRTSGAHAKVLRLTREKKIDLTLIQAISKMSYLYAKFLQDNGVPQMAFKGRLQEGADADITLFDPETVTDNSTFEQGENALPSTGIPYVLVNGTIVVKDSKVLKGIYPGRAIRNPIEN